MSSKFIRNNLWLFKFLAKAFMQTQKFFTHIVEVNNKELKPCIYALWHSDQFCIYGIKDKPNLTVLISNSIDGDIVTYAMESLGFNAVRGSSGKKGAIESTIHLINLLKEGKNVAITVDGPNGPLHKVKNGVIKLAQKSGAPIVPVCWYSAEPTFVKIPSWDKMTSPFLGCSLMNLYGEPIYIPDEITDEEVEVYREKIRTALLDLQERIPVEYQNARKAKAWKDNNFMQKFKKFVINGEKWVFLFLSLILACNSAFAGLGLGVKVDKVIWASGINSSAVSVSAKDVKTGEAILKIRQKQPMIPASTQKLLTYPAINEALGEDYLFTTKIYKTADKELYLQLSADPYLTSSDLKTLIKDIGVKSFETCKEFYIDDTVIDSEEWGEGWQWDNDLNPLMPRYSVYNIDKNLLTLIVRPTIKGSQADIRLTKFYPVTFMNLVTTGDFDDVKLSRNNHISPDILTVEGTIKKQVVKEFPVNNPKRYFLMRLDETIKDCKFDYYGEFPSKKLPESNVSLVTEVSHSLKRADEDILKNSNNYVAETVYKLAGGKYKGEQGTVDNANEMFLEYCAKNNLDTSDIRIVDGSGVSKNNIMTADFVTNFLLNEAKKSTFEEYYNVMAKPGEGTLRNRMLYFKENLRAKTGTLSDVSAIAGYLKTQSGNVVAFDIMINDHKLKDKDKKLLEEEILKTIFVNY